MDENLKLFNFFDLNFVVLKEKIDQNTNKTKCKLCSHFGSEYEIYDGNNSTIFLCSICSKINKDYNVFLDWYLNNRCFNLNYEINYRSIIQDLIKIMINTIGIKSTMDLKDVKKYIKVLSLKFDKIKDSHNIKYKTNYLVSYFSIETFDKITEYINNTSGIGYFDVKKITKKYLSKYVLDIRIYEKASTYSGFFGKIIVKDVLIENKMENILKLLKLIRLGYVSNLDWWDYNFIKNFSDFNDFYNQIATM